MEAHIRAFEIADATSVSSLISTTLRISNVKDYPAEFLSKVDASLTPSSLRASARQGRGIGRRLMEAVESEARARGERGLVLYASVSAVPFYEAGGWCTVREHRDGDAKLVVMTKPLGEPLGQW